MDLGLPSGTLWATMNVGASKPSDAGLYFQWGDTIGYTKEQVGKDKQFNWSDYKWNPSGDGENFTKYANPCDKLELEDDAAHVHMGGDWHMPTPEQIEELINTANTTITYTSLDRRNGVTFTSKNDSSKSIFIPEADGAYDSSVDEIGLKARVWSSMLNKNYVKRGNILFSYYSNNVSLTEGNRCYGFSVRGVIG